MIITVGKVMDAYGIYKDITDFAGCHPMVHHNSVKQAEEKLNPIHLNIVHQKEGHLIIHWLQLMISALPRAERDSLGILEVRADVGETIGDIREERASAENKLKEAQRTIRALQLKKIDASKYEKKARELEEKIKRLNLEAITNKNMVQTKVVEPLLRLRLSSLQNMLRDVRQVISSTEVSSTVSAGIARKMIGYVDRMTAWYTDDMINELMDHYFDNLDLGRMHAININAESGNIFLQNLRQREELITHLEHLGVTVPQLIMPVNLGRYNPNVQTTGDHWVGLYIVRHPVDGERPRILYFDPLGNPIPMELLLLLQNVYPTAEYIVNPIRFQYDGYNCGPWIIEIFRSLVRTNGMQLPPENFDIEAARLEHNTLLFPDAVLANQALSQQPAIVENATSPLLPIWSIRWNRTEPISLSHLISSYLYSRPRSRSSAPVSIFFIPSEFKFL